jgi:hypothetical protein
MSVGLNPSCIWDAEVRGNWNVIRQNVHHPDLPGLLNMRFKTWGLMLHWRIEGTVVEGGCFVKAHFVIVVRKSDSRTVPESKADGAQKPIFSSGGLQSSGH